MNIYDLKNKIIEVKAYARVIVQDYGHTVKFAKHLLAYAIKQLQQIPTDLKLIEFLCKDPIGKEIGYDHKPDSSIFSKVRERSDPQMLCDLINALLHSKYRYKILNKIVQDSTDVDAYSEKDKDAKWGKRTIPKKRQSVKKEKVEDFFGYKLHMISDADEEMPLAINIVSGNHHDKKMFAGLFRFTKDNYRLGPNTKYLADAAMDSSDLKQCLRYNGLIPVIAINGRRWRKSETPKDPDYGKRWSIERIFSRLKEMFDMRRNRFIGIKKVKMYVYSCILAYLIEYLL
jgi:hypothetical protein